MAKITGKEGLEFTGKARVFDSEDQLMKAIESKSIKQGEKTVRALYDISLNVGLQHTARLSCSDTWVLRVAQVCPRC